MKKVDEGEYFNAKLENNFSEFKVFKAEQYYTFEKSPSPEEVVSFSESFSSSKDRVAQNNNSTNNDSFDKLNKKLEQINSNSGSESSTSSSSSSLSSSTSSTTSTVSTSSVASSTSASSVASVGATGASAATVAVASVAAVVIMGGVLIDVKPYIETTKGTDYVILTIDADKIKKANEVNNSIETENYSINIENNQSIKLQKGKQKYLITGLEPSTSYKYTLDCPDLKLGGSSTVYSSTFTTSENIEVSGVYDERNCSLVFDEASKSAIYSFSLYLSDYEKQYENVSLYLTYEAVDQASDIENYIALYDVMDEDNYFKNEIVNIRYKDVFMYMIGDKVDGTSNNDLLFSHHVEIDYPSHWEVDEIPAFEVKASSEIDRSSPTQVKLQGEFTRYDDSYDLMCRVSLYDENDASLLEDAITPLQVGTSSYSFSLDARYGTKKYKYVIYTLDENNNEIILYTSPLISYTASQAYQASYTKVEPQDASITYFSDHVEIEVNPSFTSDYDNFEYRLDVVNSSSSVCASYQGRGTASITINDISSLDEINFIYYDIGHFDGQEIIYSSSVHKGGKYGFNIIQTVEGTQRDVSTNTEIISVGELSYIDNSYDFKCRVTLNVQENDQIVAYNKETSLLVNGNSYSISVANVYGTISYTYVIYIMDSNREEVSLYKSPTITFSGSQDYQASYTKVEPLDASITYFSDHVQIDVDPSFTSDYDNFEYRLDVVNSSSSVCASYQGKGTASITINDISSLDEINFIYYDIGHFDGQEIIYSSSVHKGGKYGFNIIQITDGTQEDVSTETEITSIGEVAYYDNTYSLYARVTLNIEEEDGNSTVELVSPLHIEGQTYQIIVDAYYGVQDYQYIIYMLDVNDQEVVLFTSSTITYTASQAYQASYTKVEPLDATISYFSDHVEIEVAPTYISSSNVFEYRLEVLNSSYQVCGYYQGTENAIITINNVEVLDEINFIYYDIGHFPNRDVTYNSYSYSSGKGFCLPTIQMGEALGFDGTNFTLDYSISIADTYVIESIDLVVNDGTTDYTKNILSPAKRGTIALDHVEGALGEVGITLQLKFKDNQNDNNSHSLSSQATSYTMNYEFAVTKTIADSFSASTTLPIDLYFNYRLPTTYSISIKDEANAVDITTGLAESYYLNTITPSSDINLVVQPLDESSNPVLQATTIHISSVEANSIFKSTKYSLYAVNPGDALITYNDDGTINMYRKTNFSCEDTRISMNAFIYETSSTGSDGKTIYQNGHDSIESNGYSIIEDIPSNMYIFNYYIYVDYENVRYISFMEYPSGTAGPSESIGSYEVSTASGENTIKVNISSYGYLDNRIVVNGAEYQFTTYTSMTDSTASLTLPEQEITSVKVYFTEYGSSYETVASEIPIKGNKFKEYTL